MRLVVCELSLTACLTIGGCSGGTSDPAPEAQALEVLRAHLGKDLCELSDDDARPLRDALSQLEPGPSRETIFGSTPRYIWEFGRPGEPLHYLVCETTRYTPSPFGTSIRLLLFDWYGRLRAKSEFTVGMRRWLKVARIAPGTEGDYPTVVLECSKWASRTDRDYYALAHGRFALIRTENSEP
jgi:hypothetical protein